MQVQNRGAVQAQVKAAGRGGIWFVSHHAFPNDAVVFLEIDAVFGGEVHTFGGFGPVGRVVSRLQRLQRLQAGEETLRNGERCVGEQGRGNGVVGPCLETSLETVGEDIGHRHRDGVVEVQRLETKNFFDGADEIDGVVGSGNDCALLHVGTDDEGDAAVSVNVVCAVLRIVFDDEDQGVVFVSAFGDFVHQQTDRVVVIGLLDLDGIDSVDGGF